MTPETWAEIRRLSAIQKLSISEISRRLVLDRKTVRAALHSEKGLPVREVVPKSSKLDAYKSYIQNRLKEFARITATRLLEEIRRMGYHGGITILKEYLATLRPRAQEAYLRIETQPGEQAQVDWANCGVIRIGTAVRKLSAFVMVLSFSRMAYVELSLSQCMEDFLAAHLHAFHFFGGITKKILYDNLKSVCLARFGSDIRFHPKFLEFSGACLFEPILCRPGRGNEKGKVENNIKYFRSSFLDGRPLTSWPLLQSKLLHWLNEVANVRIHGTTRQRPLDRFQIEKPLLQPLPVHEPDVSIIRPVKATKQCLVSFDGNAYSVPFLYAGRILTVKATLHEVQVYSDAKLMATHLRSFERGIVVENPAHYEGLLATKKAARTSKIVDQFLALAGSSQEAKTALESYLKGLLQSDLNLPHHLNQILELTNLYGKTEMLQAICRTLNFKAFGAPYLKNIILQQRVARGLHENPPLTIPSKPHWTQVAVEEQDLSLYDDLFNQQENPK